MTGAIKDLVYRLMRQLTRLQSIGMARLVGQFLLCIWWERPSGMQRFVSVSPILTYYMSWWESFCEIYSCMEALDIPQSWSSNNICSALDQNSVVLALLIDHSAPPRDREDNFCFSNCC